MGNKDGASFVSGWNDPPTFSYESQSQLRTGTSKQRTLLNKRVGFPLNEAPFPSNQMVQVDPTLPPTCNNVSNFPPPPSVPSSQFLDTTANSSEFGKNTTSKELLEFNSKQALETVLDRLNKILNEKYENDGKDKFDIKRRLDVMEKMWKDEKLCKDVQKRLLELSQALRSKDSDKADYLQKGLMVDHAPVCSLWMSGIRQLIHVNIQAASSCNDD